MATFALIHGGGGSASDWDHRGDQDKEVDGNPNPHKRRREPTQRMTDDHHVPTVADRLNSRVGVLLPAG